MRPDSGSPAASQRWAAGCVVPSAMTDALVPHLPGSHGPAPRNQQGTCAQPRLNRDGYDFARQHAIGRVQGRLRPTPSRRHRSLPDPWPTTPGLANLPASFDPLLTAQIDARHLDTSRVRGGTFATRGRLASLAGNPPGKSPRSVGRRPRYEQEERDHRPDGATSSIPDAGPWHGPGALEGARFIVGARKYNGNHSRGSCRALFSFKIALGAPDRLIRSFVQNAQFRLTWRWLGNCSASRRTLSVPLSQVPDRRG